MISDPVIEIIMVASTQEIETSETPPYETQISEWTHKEAETSQTRPVKWPNAKMKNSKLQTQRRFPTYTHSQK